MKRAPYGNEIASQRSIAIDCADRFPASFLIFEQRTRRIDYSIYRRRCSVAAKPLHNVTYQPDICQYSIPIPLYHRRVRPRDIGIERPHAS